MKNGRLRLRLCGTSLHLKWELINWEFKESVFLYISVNGNRIGEEELCCLVAADHHERRQTNKRLSEFYDELFALYGGKLCKKTFVLMVQS